MPKLSNRVEFTKEDVATAIASHYAGTFMPLTACAEHVKLEVPNPAGVFAQAEWVDLNMNHEKPEVLGKDAKELVERRLKAVLELAEKFGVRIQATERLSRQVDTNTNCSIGVTARNVTVVFAGAVSFLTGKTNT